MTLGRTSETILQAAIDIMSIKGYSSTTTKEIAKKAEVSEMTLFRKFPSKQDILIGIIEKYTCTFSKSQMFNIELKYDLEEDLTVVSRIYQEFMEENKQIVLFAYKECGLHDGISEKLTANPILMKQFLTDYFLRMKQMKKIIDVNVEYTVMSFMWMNLGYFSSQFLAVKNVATVPVEVFIEHSVKVFARGLKQD
jgi:AcrR family transcriptional regulator